MRQDTTDLCTAWTKGDPVLLDYHDHEWCKVCHDDRMQFELLCLEGASVGLSWRTILYKRAAYRAAFHNFDIDACAAMTDEELDPLLHNTSLIRNRGKIYGVRQNARVAQAIRQECGSLDAYLWGFSQGQVIDGHWERIEEVPTSSELSCRLSNDLRQRGMCYVGPVITYSFLQSIGIVNDHLAGCRCIRELKTNDL